MRPEFTDHEWAAIKPMLPNKPRGVPRVNDRRVLNGIFWVLRSGAPVARSAAGAFMSTRASSDELSASSEFIGWKRSVYQASFSSV